MRRRYLIAGLVLALLGTPSWPRRKQISILHSGFPNRTPIHLLIEALRALGYEDGNTAAIERLGGEGDAETAGHAGSGPCFQKAGCDRSAYVASRPRVEAGPRSDTRRFGIRHLPGEAGNSSANLSLAESNFTGVTYSEATLGGKRLELLLDALPRRVAVIWSRGFSENAAIFDAIRQAAQARGGRGFLPGGGGRARPRAYLR